MVFDKHLFISYAHIDNQPLTPDQQGWITRFHSSLEALLSMRMGSKAEIWRDDKLQGNDVFADEIVEQFTNTAVLVSVLTPRYLNSDWCGKEVAEFCKSTETSGGMVVDNKARVFKVLKAPVDSQEALPSIVQDVLGYEFFTYEDEAPLELDPAYGERYAQDYNRKVGKLAWDIAQMLKQLQSIGEAQPGGAPSNNTDDDAQPAAKATIYLAECSYDCKKTREILEGELKRHGYAVLPDQQLPRDEAEYVEAVERLLERCALSIHLVGDTHGGVPDGPTQKSVSQLQNELAAKRSKSHALRRLICLPDGTKSDQAPQQAFIDALHHDSDAQYGADLITGNLETLKTTIHTALRKMEQREEKQATAQDAGAGSARLIYLICDEKDRKATVPFRKFCRDQGFEITIPMFEGNAAAIREAHQQLMTDCDGVILFYGAGDEGWKRTLDNELKKMPCYRGDKPLLASGTYLAEPKTADKDDLIDMEEPGLINGLENFPEAALAGFFQVMNPDGAAT